MANFPHNLETLQATDETSISIGYQHAIVCVPVTVTPFASLAPTFTYQNGDAVITPGIKTLAETPGASSSFTITQNILISVPVEFGANASVGDPSVVGKAAAVSKPKAADTEE